MEVTADMVKQLREETGASVLGCKQALEKFDGDMEKAKAYLAEKGLATARKKAEREANEGIIETYTHHGGRVGVMLELNCETDFVANTDEFQGLAHDLALHIAFASPEYLDTEDVPEDAIAAQKKVYADEARADGKPEDIIERIIEGRMKKWYSEIALLQQPFVRDTDKSVRDIIVEAIALLKENIRVSRFVRYEVGGGYEDESEA
jgi:elongation factor Ts